MATTDYLSVSEAANRKGVTRAAVYLAVSTGKIPHQMIAGKIVLKVKDVEAYEPIPNENRVGIAVGGRKPSKVISDKPKRGPGRPPKAAANTAETGAEGRESASTTEGA